MGLKPFRLIGFPLNFAVIDTVGVAPFDWLALALNFLIAATSSAAVAWARKHRTIRRARSGQSPVV